MQRTIYGHDIYIIWKKNNYLKNIFFDNFEKLDKDKLINIFLNKWYYLFVADIN